MNFRLSTIAFVVMASACAEQSAIEPNRAEGEARQALARSDHRLVGVYGFAAEAPGATYSDMQRLGVRFLENTSDFQRSNDEALYNARAREYAERYNRIILEAND